MSNINDETVRAKMRKLRVSTFADVFYEIVNDELRDYRFYQEDMLHPSYQAVSYIWERFSETYMSDEAKKFIEDWRPVKAALAHRPFDANSVAYQDFVRQTHERIQALEKKWGVSLR